MNLTPADRRRIRATAKKAGWDSIEVGPCIYENTTEGWYADWHHVVKLDYAKNAKVARAAAYAAAAVLLGVKIGGK